MLSYFKQVSQCVDVRQVVDGHNFKVGSGDHLSKGEAADAAKSVDGNALHKMCSCCWFKM